MFTLCFNSFINGHKYRKKSYKTIKCQSMLLCLPEFSCSMKKSICMNSLPDHNEMLKLKLQCEFSDPSINSIAAQHFNKRVQLMCLFSMPSCLTLFMPCQTHQLHWNGSFTAIAWCWQCFWYTENREHWDGSKEMEFYIKGEQPGCYCVSYSFILKEVD